MTPTAATTLRQRLGLRYETDAGGRVIHLQFPLWMIASAAGVPFLLCSGRLLRRRLKQARRRTRGLCLACGYDLRATHRGGRCPECGTRMFA